VGYQRFGVVVYCLEPFNQLNRHYRSLARFLHETKSFPSCGHRAKTLLRLFLPFVCYCDHQIRLEGSSARRREVRVALKILWRALLGTKPQTSWSARGVIRFFFLCYPWFRSATKMLGMDTLLPSLQLCIYTYCDD